MARKSKRMQSITELTRHHEKAALEALGESSRKVEASIGQQKELERYRSEYREQMLQQGEGGFSAARMRQFQQFLSKLDAVIIQQKEQIVVNEQIREQKRNAWLESRNRTNALDKVTQRYQESEAQDELRKDQKESDERAQQRR